MDTRTFDALAVRLATRAGRRSIVVGLVASLFAFPQGKQSQVALAQMGDSCAATDDCAQTGACGVSAPVICADNGYIEDGPRNCCVGQDQLCGDHSHCCSGLLCLGSHSIDGCGAGRCLLREVVGVISRGTACTDSAQCGQDEAYAVCSEEELCCSFAGSRCIVTAQCCGGLTCVKDDPNDIRWHSPGTCA